MTDASVLQASLTSQLSRLTNLNDAAASFFGFYLVVIITCMVSYVFGMVFGGWFQDLSLALTLIGDESPSDTAKHLTAPDTSHSTIHITQHHTQQSTAPF